MYDPHALQRVYRGTAIAIMPLEATSTTEVLRVTKVRYLGNQFIGSEDGGIYSAANALGIGSSQGTFVELATDAHHEVLRQRQMAARMTGPHATGNRKETNKKMSHV